MRVRLGNGLVTVNIVNLVLFLIVFFVPSNIIRAILGVPFLIFCPGYALTVAVFPGRETSTIERLVYSFVFSIMSIPIIGFILTRIPFGLKLESALFSVSAFVFLVSLIACLRQAMIPTTERFFLEWQLPDLKMGVPEKVLVVILVIAVISGLSTLGYALARPKIIEPFTEFYILGQNGQMSSYPTQLRIGEKGSVTLVVVNHEGKAVSYKVVVTLDGENTGESGTVTVLDGETWETDLTFTPEISGSNQKLEFTLFKDSSTQVYLGPIYLYLDVSP